jgi:hypothetical protein
MWEEVSDELNHMVGQTWLGPFQMRRGVGEGLETGL